MNSGIYFSQYTKQLELNKVIVRTKVYYSIVISDVAAVICIIS